MDLMPWMQQQGMLPAAGETVLCAVSGGRDSVCLLHYLASLGRRRGFAVALLLLSILSSLSTIWSRSIIQRWFITKRKARN